MSVNVELFHCIINIHVLVIVITITYAHNTQYTHNATIIELNGLFQL